jgi:hypothetical protein
MTREAVRNAVRCPVCGSAPGSVCRINGKLTANVHGRRRRLADVEGGWAQVEVNTHADVAPEEPGLPGVNSQEKRS